MRLDKEHKLLAPVAAYVRRKGFSLQETEVQFYQYRIDLYGCSRIDRRTVAIELKLRNWRRALEQALLYQLCADLVFVALPEKVKDSVDTGFCRRYGIGMLTVSDDGRCRQVISPAQSSVVLEHYRKTYVDFLRGGT